MAFAVGLKLRSITLLIMAALLARLAGRRDRYPPSAAYGGRGIFQRKVARLDERRGVWN